MSVREMASEKKPSHSKVAVSNEVDEYVDKIEKENFNLRLRVVALERLLYNDMSELNGSTCSVDDEVDRMIREINENQLRLQEKEAEVDERLRQQNREAIARAEMFEKQVSEKTSQYETLRNDIVLLHTSINKHVQNISGLEEKLKSRDAKIDDLHTALAKIQHEKASVTQRLEIAERSQNNDSTGMRDKFSQLVSNFVELTRRLFDIVAFLSKLKDSSLLNETTMNAGSTSNMEISMLSGIGDRFDETAGGDHDGPDFHALHELSYSLQVLVQESVSLLEKQKDDEVDNVRVNAMQDALNKLEVENHDLLLQLRELETQSDKQSEALKDAEVAKQEAVRISNEFFTTLEQVKQIVRDRDIQNADLKHELDKAHALMEKQKLRFKLKRDMLKEQIKSQVDNSSAYLSGAREQVAQLVAGISAPRKASTSGKAASSNGDGNESAGTTTSATASLHEIGERQHRRADAEDFRPALLKEKAQRETKLRMPQSSE